MEEGKSTGGGSVLVPVPCSVLVGEGIFFVVKFFAQCRHAEFFFLSCVWTAFARKIARQKNANLA